MIEMQDESDSDSALNDKRRLRLEEIIEKLFDGSAANFARHIGKSDAQVSQWRTGVRNISSTTAMLIERLCDLPAGTMVDPREPKPTSVGPFEVLMEEIGPWPRPAQGLPAGLATLRQWRPRHAREWNAAAARNRAKPHQAMS